MLHGCTHTRIAPLFSPRLYIKTLSRLFLPLLFSHAAEPPRSNDPFVTSLRTHLTFEAFSLSSPDLLSNLCSLSHHSSSLFHSSFCSLAPNSVFHPDRSLFFFKSCSILWSSLPSWRPDSSQCRRTCSLTHLFFLRMFFHRWVSQ